LPFFFCAIIFFFFCFFFFYIVMLRASNQIKSNGHKQFNRIKLRRIFSTLAVYTKNVKKKKKT